MTFEEELKKYRYELTVKQLKLINFLREGKKKEIELRRFYSNKYYLKDVLETLISLKLIKKNDDCYELEK